MDDAASHAPVDAPPVSPPLSWQLAAVLLLAAVFWGVAHYRAPIPGVNESHYLGKARHFWQPEWCAGDLFLESANPHAVFYAAFGWPTTCWPLETVAHVLRFGQFLLLAWGWIALGGRVTNSLSRTLLAAALFVLWQASGTWSGEWLIGGAESKVWAYGFLMLSAAWGLDRSWARSAFAAGLAVSFHPVVGCWGLVIAGLAAGYVWFKSRRAQVAPPPPIRWRGMLVPALLFTLAALPGLIPAVQSLSAPNAMIAAEADYLQVAVRLPHHLDPLTFPVRAWRDYGLLLLIWWLLRERQTKPVHNTRAETPNSRWLELWMLAALLVAAGGLMAAWGPRPLKELPLWELRAKALKLYPFRLGDMLIPITVAFLAATRLWTDERALTRGGKIGVALLGAVAIGLACRLPIPDKILATQPPATQKDWRAAAAWIHEQTPNDALLLAINDNWALRWYAERPEYFHFKDCPQDAASIVEWNRRYQVIYQWKLKAFADGRGTIAELTELRRQTGVTHLLCFAYIPMEARPAFASPTYRIYSLPAPPVEPRPPE